MRQRKLKKVDFRSTVNGKEEKGKGNDIGSEVGAMSRGGYLCGLGGKRGGNLEVNKGEDYDMKKNKPRCPGRGGLSPKIQLREERRSHFRKCGKKN